MTVVALDTRRRDKIGGSEAAAACGVDPFRSRVMLWAEKTGRVERPETEAMKWGKLLEPVVFQELERQGYPVTQATDLGVMPGRKMDGAVVAADKPWMTGHPDGLLVPDGCLCTFSRCPLHGESDGRGLVEVKTTGAWANRESNGTPLHYVAQLQHYFYVTGLSSGILGVLVGGQRLEVFEVPRDDRVIEAMLEREEDFLRYVRTDRPPPPDGSDSAHDAIRALHPTGNGKTIRLSRDQWRDVRELKQRKEQAKHIDTQAAELQQRIELAMGDAEHAVSPYDTPAARWVNVDSTRLDTKALKAARPDVYAEFAVPTSTRRFTLES